MTRSPFSPRAIVRRLSRRVALSRLGTEDDGAVTVIVAFSMTVILGMAALVVDIGGAELRKAQLQDAADAAATAIADRCYDAAGTTVLGCDPSVIAGASASALWYAQKALGQLPVSVAGIDFALSGSSVKVTLASTQDSIFAKIFGVESSNVTADATAQWGLPATPLPLAYNECALPQTSATTKQFLRYDLLDIDLQHCGLIGGVLNELGNGWLNTPSCSFDVNLLTYLTDVLTKVLPTSCSAKVAALKTKYVLLPVYSHVLTNIVVKGVLLGQGYQVQKYALVQVTGYDFQTVNVNLLGLGVSVGPADISGDPQCPAVNLLNIVNVNDLLCQGLQGYFVQYLTPTEAAARLNGVQLVS